VHVVRDEAGQPTPMHLAARASLGFAG
jgi:hypothetical protein